MEQQQQQLDGSPQLRKSCDYCVRMKRGCDGGTPCELCSRRNKHCIRSVKKRSGPAKGTKYCKRKPRKTPKVSSFKSYDPSATAGSASATGGGATAACASSTLSGGPLAGPHRPACELPSGRGGTGTFRLSPSKHIKHEVAGADFGAGASGSALAAAALAGFLPPKHEASPLPGAAVALESWQQRKQQQMLQQQHQDQQHLPLRSREVEHDGGGLGQGHADRAPPGGVIDQDPSYSSCGTTFDSDGSRRSSLGDGIVLGGSDRCYSLEVDPCSGSLLPFFFAPCEGDPAIVGGSVRYDGGGGGGGGGAVVGSWGEGDMSGGGRSVAADYASGGGSVEAELSVQRSSLEEALFGDGHKRTSFSSWNQPPLPYAPRPHPAPHHHHSSSAEGLAWNQLLQQADAESQPNGSVQGRAADDLTLRSTGFYGGGFSAEAADDDGDIDDNNSSSSQYQQNYHHHHHQRHHHHQQIATSMRPPPVSILPTADARDAEAGAGSGSGSGSGDAGAGKGGSAMRSLKDLLLDATQAPRPGAPPLVPSPPPFSALSVV